MAALTFEKTFLIFFEKGSCKTLHIHKILRSFQTWICKSWSDKGTGTRVQVKFTKELIYSVCVGIVIVDHERLKGPHMGRDIYVALKGIKGALVYTNALKF